MKKLRFHSEKLSMAFSDIRFFIAAFLNFIVWLGIMLSTYDLAGNLGGSIKLGQMELRSNDAGETALLIYMALIFLLTLFSRNKEILRGRLFNTMRLLSLIQLILWLAVIFAPWGPFRQYLDPENAIGIIRGFWMWESGIMFFVLGVNSIIILAIAATEVNERYDERGKSAASLIFGCSLLSFLFFLIHPWLMAWNIDLMTALIASFFLAFKAAYSTADIGEKSCTNSESNDNENGKNDDAHKNGDDVARPEMILPFQLYVFIIVLLLPVAIQATALPIMNYMRYRLTFLIITGSFGAIAGIYTLLQFKKSEWVVRRIPWWSILAAAFVLFLIMTYDLHSRYLFPETSYYTNPTYPPAIALDAIIYCLLWIAFDLARLQSVYTTGGKDSGDMRRMESLKKWHYFGRSVMIITPIASWIYALRWLNEVSFRDFYGSGLILMRNVVWVLLTIFLIAVFLIERIKGNIMAKGSGPNVSGGNIEMERKDIHGEQREPAESKNILKKISGVGIISAAIIVMMLLPSITPRVFFTNQFDVTDSVNESFRSFGLGDIDPAISEPHYLGALGPVSFTEMPSMIKVSRGRLFNNPYLTKSNDAGAIPVISRSMAKNEFESLQLILSNYGTERILVQNITVSPKEGLPSAFSMGPVIKSWKGEPWPWQRFMPYYVDEIHPGYPNILYPFNENVSKIKVVIDEKEPKPPAVAEPGKSLTLWITLYAAEDLNPGNYSDIITIETNSGNFSIELKSRIWNFTIPTTHSFRTAIGCGSTSLPNRDEWNRNFLIHRISPYFVYNPSNLFERNGSTYIFNFTEFEEDLSNAIAFGLDSFAIMYAPAGISNDGFTSEFNESTINFYRPLAEFLKNHTLSDGRTWLDLAYIYAIDEPEEDFYPACNKWAELIHKADPGWKVLLTEQVEPELDKDIDIWVPIMNAFNVSNIPIQHQKGNEVWYYTCCHLTHQPTISFIDPAADHRALFWNAYAHGFDGYLYWSANAYINAMRYDKYWVGFDNIGGSALVLSDGYNHPINTIVWETMRDGLEDVEYFEMLKNRYPNSEIINAVRQYWADFYEYPRDSASYLVIREMIGEILNVA